MNKIYIWICFVSLAMGMVSCKQNDGYYDYENKEGVFDGTTIAYYQSKMGIYDSLLLVLERLPEYKEIIDRGDATVFSPTNASFRLALTNLNLIRANQDRPALSLRTIDLAQLDTLISKYIVKGVIGTDEMLFVDGLYVETAKNTEENDGRMHAQRIKQQSSGFVDGGLTTVYYSDTKASNFVDQWIRATTQGVNIRTSNSLIHILANDHEFGFGEFLGRMNK